MVRNKQLFLSEYDFAIDNNFKKRGFKKIQFLEIPKVQQTTN